VPNVCKMPGPPAPFVPTPLPNIGKSGDSAKDYSTSVKIEGNAVAIRGSSFGSQGDMASKGTGGGIVSMNTHGPTKFVGPGSMNVKIEGKNVHLLTDQMSNNHGPNGGPPNSATLAGLLQDALLTAMRINPENHQVCEEGEHIEEIVKPDTQGQTVEERINDKARAAKSEGDRFEVAAVLHNLADAARGNLAGISNANQISRGPSDSDKVWAVCRKCGYRREIDHVLDDGTAVEAKSSGKALSDSEQKVNNAALRVGCIYKSPSNNWQRAKSLWTDYRCKHITVPFT
jgi:uncharacterized Zn-binding protein involved in type VI secretion